MTDKIVLSIPFDATLFYQNRAHLKISRIVSLALSAIYPIMRTFSPKSRQFTLLQDVVGSFLTFLTLALFKKLLNNSYDKKAKNLNGAIAFASNYNKIQNKWNEDHTQFETQHTQSSWNSNMSVLKWTKEGYHFISCKSRVDSAAQFDYKILALNSDNFEVIEAKYQAQLPTKANENINAWCETLIKRMGSSEAG